MKSWKRRKGKKNTNIKRRDEDIGVKRSLLVENMKTKKYRLQTCTADKDEGQLLVNKEDIVVKPTLPATAHS